MEHTRTFRNETIFMSVEKMQDTPYFWMIDARGTI